jgi:hypothetical protein
MLKIFLVVIIGLLLGVGGFFIGRYTSPPPTPYFVDEKHKEEGKWLKIPVVDPWKGKVVRGQPQGEVVGTLYIKTEGEYIDFHFIHKDDICQYGGEMAWEALARAMKGKGPLISTKVDK